MYVKGWHNDVAQFRGRATAGSCQRRHHLEAIEDAWLSRDIAGLKEGPVDNSPSAAVSLQAESPVNFTPSYALIYAAMNASVKV
jgi:hypothetical protein